MIQRFLKSRIFFLVVTLVFFVALFLYKESPQKLNVIVISIDSLRADHMSLYGYARNTTPVIDAWAEHGLVFDNYFATSYLTPISEVSVQTGDYPITTGAINFETSAYDSVPLLAELLKQNGYATAAFSSSPEYGINPAVKKTFERGFDTFIPVATSTNDQVSGQRPLSVRTSTAPVNDSLAWLKDGRDKTKPFYLWLPLGTIHWPFNDGKPNRFSDPSYKGYLASMQHDEFNTVYGFIFNGKRYDPSTETPSSSSVVAPLTPTDQKFIVDRYDDGIAAADTMLAGLFTYLKESGLDKNTIVVIESEHGETLGEHGYFAHYDIYDETTHVPLIMTVPGMTPARVQTLASGVDIVPTLLSILHIPQETPIDGVDLTPFLSGAATSSPRSEVYFTRTPLWERVAQFPPAFTAADNTAHYYDTGIQNADWELIHRLSRAAQLKYGWWGLLTGKPTLLPEYQLYNLQQDPQEKVDVYALHKNDLAIVALKAKLTVWEAQMKSRMPGPTPVQEIQPYF